MINDGQSWPEVTKCNQDRSGQRIDGGRRQGCQEEEKSEERLKNKGKWSADGKARPQTAEAAVQVAGRQWRDVVYRMLFSDLYFHAFLWFSPTELWPGFVFRIRRTFLRALRRVRFAGFAWHAPTGLAGLSHMPPSSLPRTLSCL